MQSSSAASPIQKVSRNDRLSHVFFFGTIESSEPKSRIQFFQGRITAIYFVLTIKQMARATTTIIKTWCCAFLQWVLAASACCDVTLRQSLLASSGVRLLKPSFFPLIIFFVCLRVWSAGLYVAKTTGKRNRGLRGRRVAMRGGIWTLRDVLSSGTIR